MEEDVSARLREVGYPIVMRNYRAGSLRPDVVGFLPSRSGVLMPHTVVEVKASQKSSRGDEEALERLAGYRQSLGTRVHYVVAGNSWRRADAGLRALLKESGPEDVRDHVGNCALLLEDESVIRAALDGELASLLASHQGQEKVTFAGIASVLNNAANGSLLHQQNQRITLDREAVWRVVQDWLPTVMSGMNRGDLSTPAPIADFMARLSEGPKGSLLDPFCGSGMLLLRAGSLAPKECILYGCDLNKDIVDVTRALGNFASNRVEFHCANALQDNLPNTDFVISAPPFGLRLSHPFQLSNGDTTHDGELAAIDVCLQALAPGGRMVLLTSRSWLIRDSGLRYRDYLTNKTHVQALIGLPGGLLRSTPIPTTVVIIDKDKPGQTFIADLSADWESELSSEGAAWQALRGHLESRQNG